MGVGQVPVLATRLPVALFRGLLPCLEWRLFGRRLIRSGGRPWKLDAAWYATTGPNLRGCCWGAVWVLAVASTGTSLRFGQFRWGGAERCRDYIRTTVDCHCHRGVDLWKQVGHRTKSLASNAGERSGFALKSRVGFRHRPGVAQYHRSTKMHNEALGTRLVLLSEFDAVCKNSSWQIPSYAIKDWLRTAKRLRILLLWTLAGICFVPFSAPAQPGIPLWTNCYNGSGNGSDNASAVAVDSSGNVYVTGSSRGRGTRLEYATVAY